MNKLYITYYSTWTWVLLTGTLISSDTRLLVRRYSSIRGTISISQNMMNYGSHFIDLLIIYSVPRRAALHIPAAAQFQDPDEFTETQVQNQQQEETPQQLHRLIRSVKCEHFALLICRLLCYYCLRCFVSEHNIR